VDGLGQLGWVIITTAFYCVPLGLSVWALLDCAKRPGWAWAMSDRSRQVWMASILFGILVVPVGIAISLWYLLRVRPDIAGIEAGRLPDLDWGTNDTTDTRGELD
jgi:hypothetical protein